MGYEVHIADDGQGNPVPIPLGGTTDEASNIFYKKGTPKEATVEKKIDDIDEALGQNFVIADSSKKWNGGRYEKDQTCIWNEKVWRCKITHSNVEPSEANSTYWENVSLSEILEEVDALKNTLGEKIVGSYSDFTATNCILYTRSIIKNMNILKINVVFVVSNELSGKEIIMKVDEKFKPSSPQNTCINKATVTVRPSTDSVTYPLARSVAFNTNGEIVTNENVPAGTYVLDATLIL